MGPERNNNNSSVFLFARLNNGVTARQAAEQLAPGFRAWNASLPAKNKPDWLDLKNNPRLEVVSARTGYSGLGLQYKRPLVLLQSLVCLLLFASSAYLGTLLSARSIARRREIALRAALGASRSRLIRQLFSESLLLAFTGSALGVMLAWGASRFLLTFVQSEPGAPAIPVGPGRDVLLFTLGVTALAVLLWGFLPALHASRVAFASDMKSGGTTSLSGMRSGRVGRWLVPVQIALSLLIVVVAGLLSTTLVHLLSQNNGYRLAGTVFAGTDFPFVYGKDEAPRIAAELRLQQSVLERLNHTPGIQAASVDIVHALGGATYSGIFHAQPDSSEDDVHGQTIMNNVAPRYFQTLGTPLFSGRDFNDGDTATSQPVCILTRAAAQRYFPNAEAAGRMLYQPQAKDKVKAFRVIGVVGDMRYNDLRTDAPPLVYLDFTQAEEARNLEFVMKADNPAAAVASLRDILRSTAPGVHVTDTITMKDQVNRSLARERLLATLSNFFAGLGLLLGAISLYGVLSYSVNCRRAEIGVRMALGASRGNVVRLFIGEAARLVIPGILLGAVACAAVTRLLSNLLYQTRPLDPLAATLSVAAIAVTALIASWLPSRRAAAIDPMQALRAE